MSDIYFTIVFENDFFDIFYYEHSSNILIGYEKVKYDIKLDDEEFYEILEKSIINFIEKYNVSTYSLHIVVNNIFLTMKIIELKNILKSKIKSTLSWNLGDYFVDDLETIIWNYKLLFSKEKNYDILIYSLNKQFYDKIYEISEKLDLIVENISTPLYTIFDIKPDLDSVSAHLNIGESISTLIIYENNIIKTFRKIQFGFNDIIADLVNPPLQYFVSTELTEEQANAFFEKYGFVDYNEIYELDVTEDEQVFLEIINKKVLDFFNKVEYSINFFDNTSQNSIESIYITYDRISRNLNVDSIKKALLNIFNKKLYFVNSYNLKKNSHKNRTILLDRYLVLLSIFNKDNSLDVLKEISFLKRLEKNRFKLFFYTLMILLFFIIVSFFSIFFENKKLSNFININKRKLTIFSPVKNQFINLTNYNNLLSKDIDKLEKMYKSRISFSNMLKRILNILPNDINFIDMSYKEHEFIKLRGYFKNRYSFNSYMSVLSNFKEIKKIELLSMNYDNKFNLYFFEVKFNFKNIKKVNKESDKK